LQARHHAATPHPWHESGGDGEEIAQDLSIDRRILRKGSIIRQICNAIPRRIREFGGK
jgi:hypothetical protein